MTGTRSREAGVSRMPTWNNVFPYSVEFRDWLRGEGDPCPDLIQGNRAPTAGEILAACERLQSVLVEHPVSPDCDDFDFSWNRPDSVATMLKMRDDDLGHWHLLLELSRICGQFFYWPESGAPVLIIEPDMDANVIDAVYREAINRDDGWKFVLRSLYGE
jgi:hypothetical protein